AICAAAFSILPARGLSSRPSSPLTTAAAPFRRASQWTTATGTVSPEIGKLSTALAVSPPQSCLSVIGFGSPWKLARGREGARRHVIGSAAECGDLACESNGIVVGEE